jgi:AraC-like DNA-binding protein
VLASPMHELAGRFTAVADLSASLSREFDRVLDSDDPIGRVEAALLSEDARDRDLLVTEAVRRIIQARGAVDLGVLAKELGVSIRHFERRFNARVGLSPKVFCRMQRFVHVFQVVSEQPGKWADAAVVSGYYDQAHLIRDFREFSGETPAVLLSEDADLARHFLQRFGVSHSYKTTELHSV